MHFKATASFILATALLVWTSPAQAAPTNTCYINEKFAVSASSTDEIDNQVFSVVRKKSPTEAVACPIDPSKAEFVIGADSFGQTYTEMLDNLFVITAHNGQMSDLLVIDLATNKTVLNVSGTFEYATPDAIYYWERGEAGTPETCANYDEITANGLDIGLLHEKEFNLKTFKSTATGETDCEGIS